ncbi:hypothetical protein [Candidatus Vidania fulgoroideorum]
MLNKKIYIKKINFNIKISEKNKKKIIKIINFFLKTKNYIINFVFIKNIEFLKIVKKFSIKNCDNKLIVFNYNYGNILIKNFVSDVFINKTLLTTNLTKTFFHCLYHVCGLDHKTALDFRKMIHKYNLFKNYFYK